MQQFSPFKCKATKFNLTVKRSRLYKPGYSFIYFGFDWQKMFENNGHMHVYIAPGQSQTTPFGSIFFQNHKSSVNLVICRLKKNKQVFLRPFFSNKSNSRATLMKTVNVEAIMS